MSEAATPWYKRPQWVAIIVSLLLGVFNLVLGAVTLWSDRTVESGFVTLTGFNLDREESTVRIDLTFVNDGTQPLAVLDAHFYHPIRDGWADVWPSAVEQVRLQAFTLPPGDITTRRLAQRLDPREIAEFADDYEPADSTVTLGVRIVTLGTDGAPRAADAHVVRLARDLRSFEGSNDLRWGPLFTLKLDLIDDSRPYSPHEFGVRVDRVSGLPE